MKKVLTKHKTYDIINELIQMSEKLKQFKQFNKSSVTKVFEKKMKKVLDIKKELW